MSLAGKNALVTGASRGIGQAVAVDLCRAGARVVCVSTREGGCDHTVALCREAGGEAEAFAGDVSDEADVGRIAEGVLAAGELHVLVNNAGITRDGLFLRMSTEDFDRVLAVNLRGVFLLTKALARAMAKVRGARIVNVSSVVGMIGNAGQANYAASKAGLIGFTKALAKEFGGRGMTVNAVAPGFIETDMTRDLSEGVRSAALQTIPLARFGNPEDIAGAVRFLCSDAASYITGQVVVVDGGMTM